MASASSSRNLHADSPLDAPTIPTSNSGLVPLNASQASDPQNEPSTDSTLTPGHPNEELQVEEPNEDGIKYPTGPQLWLNMVSLLLVSFCHGLDLTIVAVAVPSLTNEFKTLADIGWYSAGYGLVFSSTNFFFGKMYTLFSLKAMYMVSVVIFEFGSVLCTFAPTSKAFILGRAIAGMCWLVTPVTQS